MKKLLAISALVFCMAFAVGTQLAPAPASAGFSFCWYQCGCNGVPEWCCAVNGSVACKPAPWAPIGCPQIADC